MRVPEPILTIADLDNLVDVMTDHLAHDMPDPDFDPFRWSNLVTHHTYLSLGLPDNALELARQQDKLAQTGEVPVWEDDLSSIIDDMENKIVQATMRHYVAPTVTHLERIKMLISGDFQ